MVGAGGVRVEFERGLESNGGVRRVSRMHDFSRLYESIIE
jgi:hypothetical protein